jgi:hypothetical protein
MRYLLCSTGSVCNRVGALAALISVAIEQPTWLEVICRLWGQTDSKPPFTLQLL